MCAVCKPDHRAPHHSWRTLHLPTGGDSIYRTLDSWWQSPTLGRDPLSSRGGGQGLERPIVWFLSALVIYAFMQMASSGGPSLLLSLYSPSPPHPYPLTPPFPPRLPKPNYRLLPFSFLLLRFFFFLSQTRNSYSPTLLVTLRLVTGLWVRAVLSLIKGVRASHRALSPSKSQP